MFVILCDGKRQLSKGYFPCITRTAKLLLIGGERHRQAILGKDLISLPLAST
jgi:hypothetical protein